MNLQAEGGAPEPKYSDLNSLVADYMKKGDKNGLAFGLKFPVPPDRGEEVDSGVYIYEPHQIIYYYNSIHRARVYRTVIL